MRRTRVLIVDDSVVMRRLLSDVLGSDPDLEVAGTAAHGRIALAKMSDLAPDVVVLDVEMPVMDGLETLRALQRSDPELPVVMFSSLTARGAGITLDALLLGASDYVAKPTSTKGLAQSTAQMRSDLIPKIKALSVQRYGTSGSRPAPPRPAPPVHASVDAAPHAAPGSHRRIDVVAIGASTGGPNALSVLFSVLPADLPVPVVVVQHMPPVFTKALAKRLAARSALDVREGAAGDVLCPGTVWIAPGGHHMEVERQGTAVQLRTHDGARENNCRPAADVLFRSVARVYGPHALAVVLTGMGRDGLRGGERIAEAGGQLIAQDEATSVVWGMPKAIAQAGLADQVLPLGRIGGAVAERVRRSRAAGP